MSKTTTDTATSFDLSNQTVVKTAALATASVVVTAGLFHVGAAVVTPFVRKLNAKLANQLHKEV